MKRCITLMLTLLALASGTASLRAEEVYRDTQVRFTLIDEGTIRMEYAPDGRFVDEKSFMAVIREYGKQPCQVKETGKTLTITTSKFKLTYKKGTGAFTADNLTITSTRQLGMAFTWRPGTEQKQNLKGTYRTLDGYDGAEYQYANPKHPMPIEDGLLARDGWTLIDDSKTLLFDGSDDWDWVKERESKEGAQDWYFMAYGHDYKGALRSYTRFAGGVPLPPRYTFGYWWSRYWSYSDQDLRNLIGQFQQLDLPLDVLVIDMDWHPISEAAGGGWTGWDWNERLFPDYKKFLAYLDEQGVKTTMNLHPADGVRPYEKKYKEFIQRAGIPDGRTEEWQGSNKRYVRALFDTYLHPYIDEGVDFWWLDWQQWEKDKTLGALDNVFWCNYIWFSDMERNGVKRPLLYHRWGGLGNHRYQIGFSGDSYITWASLKFLPYFNSTASNVLYGYWSHDIGGHQSKKYGTPVEPELYTRAMQMGQYLPILRSHSTKDPQLNKEPWAFDQQTQRRLANVINGRYALVPYIYTMARECSNSGLSLCRPLYYDYPEVEEAYAYREEYMFGERMLIAPVTDPVDATTGYATVDVWLPEGEWLEYETGTLLQGGRAYKRRFTMDEYPVYVKAGSILPYFGHLRNLSGTTQPLTIRLFPGGTEQSFSYYEDNGEDKLYRDEYATTLLSYRRDGDHLTVSIGPRKGHYKDMPARRDMTLSLPCQLAPQSATMGGKKLGMTYDGLNLETLIPLGSIDCATGTTVDITLSAADCAVVDGTKARFHRILSAVQDYKQHDAGMVYTAAYGLLEATPLRLAYHPESQRETLAAFQDTYSRLTEVLVEQMGRTDNYKRTLRLLDEEDRLTPLPATAFQSAKGTGFDATYYNNKRMEAPAVATKHMERIDFFESGSPVAGVEENGWSMVAESEFCADETADIMFFMTGDDAYRLIVDGQELFADWGDHAETSRHAVFHAEKGRKYPVRIEYYDNEYNAILRFEAAKIAKRQDN